MRSPRKISSGWRCSPATTAWRQKADRLIAAIAPLVAENLYMHMALLNAIDLRLRAAEIVVTGAGASAPSAARRARANYRRSTASCSTRARPRIYRHRIRRRKKSRLAAEPQAFVCIGETCSLPVTDPAGLVRAIAAVRQS